MDLGREHPAREGLFVPVFLLVLIFKGDLVDERAAKCRNREKGV